MEDQAEQHQKWWQQIKRPLVIGIIAVSVLLVALIVVEVRLYGTGFKGKTLWDWMQLLFIPVVLAVAGFWFNYRERKAAEKRAEIERNAAQQRADAEREIEQQRAKAEQEIASDYQREAALQAYIDKISELLLHEDLSKLLLDEPLDETSLNRQVVIIALARTTTVLRILDQGRRGSLIRFLSQARILTKCIKDELVGIDLRGAVRREVASVIVP